MIYCLHPKGKQVKNLREFVAVRCVIPYRTHPNAAIWGQVIGFLSEKAARWCIEPEYPGMLTGNMGRETGFSGIYKKENASMKHMNCHKIVSVMLCIVLIAALALTITACGSKETATGSASISYTVITVDLDGKETTYNITTNQKMVGDELLAQGIIAGEESDYGLYIHTVDGITLDWDKDGKYWAFYINGEYAMTGVDMTEAEDGATYTLKPES